MNENHRNIKYGLIIIVPTAQVEIFCEGNHCRSCERVDNKRRLEAVMKRETRRVNINLYYKFAMAMILLGFFPMLVLSTFMINGMLDEYRIALVANYEQVGSHFSSSIDNMLSVYDNAAKYVYQYNFGVQGGQADYSVNYDNIRRILTGEIYDEQNRNRLRAREMHLFEQNVASMISFW